ncbi:MAG TPA: flagellar filament capping protein FliD [Jatrophihabitans sp.]|jgi:flagellar hook-associated protein 2
MTSTGSISLTGLLGGTAGQIDVNGLISQLMTAATVPQGQLYDQLNTQQLQAGIYQTINTKITSLQTAAQAVSDPGIWSGMKAASSDGSVVATSTGSPTQGSTTFSVMQTATAQMTIISADSSGSVLASPTGSITVTDSSGLQHQITPPSGSAAAVAGAINGIADSGVHASVVSTRNGPVVQIVSTGTGSSNGFSISTSGSWATPTADPVTGIVPPTGPVTTAAQDAEIQVGTGDPATGGYTVTSSSNTFVDAIPGVTFTVSALATNVTVGVSQDTQSIADKVQALVNAANTVQSEVGNDTQQGSPLQGTAALNEILGNLGYSVSMGTSTGKSLADWGIDIDKNGVFSFDEDTFTQAYNADPTGTQAAMGDFASSLADTADKAVNPTYGTITLTLSQITSTESTLNDSIASWTDRLNNLKDSLTAKFTAMETALATLQSRQTYLTNMFNQMNGTSSSSSQSS